jgi:hypothetical protein
LAIAAHSTAHAWVTAHSPTHSVSAHTSAVTPHAAVAAHSTHTSTHPERAIAAHSAATHPHAGEARERELLLTVPTHAHLLAVALLLLHPLGWLDAVGVLLLGLLLLLTLLLLLAATEHAADAVECPLGHAAHQGDTADHVADAAEY